MKKHISDSERFSIVQPELDYCFVCRKRGVRLFKHEVFGGANRQNSKDYGMVVALCFNHHDRTSPISVHSLPMQSNDLEIKAKSQLVFEEEYGHEKFMEIFKKNYIAIYEESTGRKPYVKKKNS